MYFLFGEDEDAAKPLAYIGQTEDAVKRFGRHSKERAFWKTAVFIVSKTQNFTQAHIRYLEWHCIHNAIDVGRYKLTNEQVPASTNDVPKPMQAELLDVFETVNTLVAALGHPIFEPLSSRSPSTITFYCQGGGSDGKGECVEDGFVVLAGSKARKEISPASKASIEPKRDALNASGVLEESEGDYQFTQDYLFPAPSTAAAVVLGRSANGWTEWKDKNGATLNEIYREPDEVSRDDARSSTDEVVSTN